MGPIRAIILEDDAAAADYIGSVLSSLTNIILEGHAKTLDTGVHLINTVKPDLVFMDVELEDGTGFDVLEKITVNSPDIIFVTAHDVYLRTAMEHYAFYYLTKPFEPEALLGVVHTYMSNLVQRKAKFERDYGDLVKFLKHDDSRLLINVGNEHVFIAVNDIVKCTAEGNYTYFFLKDSLKYLAYHPLKYFEDLLTEKGFFRASRQALVNLNNIKSIYKREAFILTNGDRVTISTRNKGKLGMLIKKFA
ncbi:LytR/AlgR family response regulator transcription factor [Maribacter sp. 2-571]|uniref:LytR/AlgR family response regulator transcription factor n=1 Tax=Maribacter sp. 2-571 TaxID=3417569 RepID=UPI003D33487C